MLQAHQIIAEYNNAISEADREKLKDGAFEDVLRKWGKLPATAS
jgi:sucrose synthase